MNIAQLFSIAGSIAIFIISVFMAFDNPMVLIDLPSVVIVFGGTLFATFASFSPKKVIAMTNVYIRRILRLNLEKYTDIVEDIVMLSKAKRAGKREFDAAIQKARHPFLVEGGGVLFWAESDISDQELEDLLVMKANSVMDENVLDTNMFKSIAKFPPAFGMMGTTIGMIALLGSLGGDNLMDTLGGSMAVALITTLYGIVISNVFIIPAAENLGQSARESDLARRMIIVGLMEIHKNKPTMYVEEKVKALLRPGLRGPSADGNRKKAA